MLKNRRLLISKRKKPRPPKIIQNKKYVLKINKIRKIIYIIILTMLSVHKNILF